MHLPLTEVCLHLSLTWCVSVVAVRGLELLRRSLATTTSLCVRSGHGVWGRVLVQFVVEATVRLGAAAVVVVSMAEGVGNDVVAVETVIALVALSCVLRFANYNQ